MDQTLFFLSNQVFELVASSYTKKIYHPLDVNDVQSPHYNMLPNPINIVPHSNTHYNDPII
jgi:hypothetical protein